jgi:hypothetical protein
LRHEPLLSSLVPTVRVNGRLAGRLKGVRKHTTATRYALHLLGSGQ